MKEELNVEENIPEDMRENELNNPFSEMDNLSGMDNPQDANAIKYQIDVQEYLDEIERILRGYVKIKDEESGEEYYGLPRKRLPSGELVPDYSKEMLNDFGVGKILGFISVYINKHVSLSIFDETRINEICYELSKNVRRFVLACAYQIGLDTQEKMDYASILVISSMNSVESCLRRSMKGATLETLNKSTLNSNPVPNGMGYPSININSNPRASRKSLLNPFSWFRRPG